MKLIFRTSEILIEEINSENLTAEIAQRIKSSYDYNGLVEISIRFATAARVKDAEDLSNIDNKLVESVTITMVNQ